MIDNENEYLLYVESLDIGLPIGDTVEEYKMSIDNCVIMDEYKINIEPYYFIRIYDDDYNIIKITKISIFEPKYVYVKSIYEKPKMIDILSDDEIDRMVTFINEEDYYKKSLYFRNLEHNDDTDKYIEYFDTNRNIPDYSLLKNNKNIEIINIKFYHIFYAYLFKIKMFFRRILSL